MARYRIRPSKLASAVGMIVGIVFVGIGILVVIPVAGWFGLLWTGMAATAVIFNAINVFSESGFGSTEIVEDMESSTPTTSLTFDDRLRRLQQLKDDELISDVEYEKKRAEILKEQW